MKYLSIFFFISSAYAVNGFDATALSKAGIEDDSFSNAYRASHNLPQTKRERRNERTPDRCRTDDQCRAHEMCVVRMSDSTGICVEENTR